MLEAAPLNVIATAVVIAAAFVVGYLLLRRQEKQYASEMAFRNSELEKERAARARSEQETALKDQWFGAVVQGSRDLVLVCGLDENGMPGRFVTANDAACEALGYPRERLLDMTPMDVEEQESTADALPGYSRAEVVAMSDADIRDRQRSLTARTWRRLLNDLGQKKRVRYDRVFVAHDGQRIPVEISANLLEFPDPPAILFVARDVSDRRRAEHALRESERRVLDFLSHSPIGVAMYDAHRELVHVNQACLRMLGIPDAPAFARFDLFNSPFLSDPVKERIHKGETTQCEATIDFDAARSGNLLVTSRRGASHFNLFISNLGLDREYKPRGYLVQIQDITKRRQAEQALLESERQLRQAQKMEAIGTLAGGIAHDFNNILTPILGYAEMGLDMVREGSEARDYFNEILSASHRAKDLVNQILAFSRQRDSGGQPIHVVPIVKEVMRQQQAMLPATIEVRTVIKTAQDVVVANPTQIHQVILNLCTNAVHAMRDTGGVLEASLSDFVIGQRPATVFPGLREGRYIGLSLKDTGVGMDEDTQERIFEPFFTTKESGEGTGMGLAVVHGIVTSLKGGIRVESAPGKGTEFQVVFPLLEDQAPREFKSDRAAPAGSECVLFVDDEADVSRMVGRMLSSLGYQPVLAASGKEALALVRESPDRFDLVISDRIMPDLSGPELLREIRDLRRGLPTMLCTGFSDTLGKEALQSMGVSEVLVKPITTRALATTVRRALDGVPSPGVSAGNP